MGRGWVKGEVGGGWGEGKQREIQGRWESWDGSEDTKFLLILDCGL